MKGECKSRFVKASVHTVRFRLACSLTWTMSAAEHGDNMAGCHLQNFLYNRVVGIASRSSCANDVGYGLLVQELDELCADPPLSAVDEESHSILGRS